MASKLNDAEIKRQLFKLRKEIINARKRWGILLRERSVTKRVVNGECDRSPSKVLYFVRSDNWLEPFKKEISALQARINKAGYVGKKTPRSLWLPAVIENPSNIMLNIYQAKSVREIDVGQARAIIKKFGGVTKLSDDKYSIHSITGRSYKLRACHKDGVSYYNITDWSVCIFSGKMPHLKPPNNMSHCSDLEFKNAIYTYKNSALYKSDSASPLGITDKKLLEEEEEDDEDAEWL